MDNEYNAKEVATRIRTLAKQIGSNVNKMLRACGFGKSLISDMEARGAFPTTDKVAKIANYLGVTIDYLLEGKEGFTMQKNLLSSDLIKEALFSLFSAKMGDSPRGVILPSNITYVFAPSDKYMNHTANVQTLKDNIGNRIEEHILDGYVEFAAGNSDNCPYLSLSNYVIIWGALGKDVLELEQDEFYKKLLAVQSASFHDTIEVKLGDITSKLAGVQTALDEDGEILNVLMKTLTKDNRLLTALTELSEQSKAKEKIQNILAG